MKGLLIKDIKLMVNMKNSLLLILLIAVVMATYLSDASFLVIYLGLIGATFTNSTLSYDEYDNGYAFLLSLPVTRKDYAVEKYCFGLLLSGGGWLLGAVLMAVSGMARNNMTPSDAVMNALIMFPMVLILLSVLLPVHMKFGGEKSRIVIIGAAGCLFGVFVVVLKVLERMNLNLNARLEKLPMPGIGAAAAIGFGFVIMLISCRISISIMEKKEF